MSTTLQVKRATYNVHSCITSSLNQEIFANPAGFRRKISVFEIHSNALVEGYQIANDCEG